MLGLTKLKKYIKIKLTHNMNEKILLLSNVLLVAFTGIYVFLTYRLIKITTQNSKTNNRINSLPLIDCRIIKQRKKIRLQIQNISHNSAFDLDIWFFGILFDSTISKRDLLNKYVFDDKNQLEDDVNLHFVDDEQYAVSERGIYPTLPINKMIDYEIKYPFKIDQFDIYIQYRDHIGNNYGQLYWFYEKDNEFTLGKINPDIIYPTNRLDLTDDKQNLKKIPKEFYHMILRNYYSIDGRRILNNENFEVESRWKIK